MHSWTLDDMPDLSGTTAVVTGANSGIGAVTALALARSGARTILACRDPERGGRALDAVRRAAPGSTPGSSVSTWRTSPPSRRQRAGSRRRPTAGSTCWSTTPG